MSHEPVDYGNTKITRHTLEVSVFRMLKLDTIPMKMSETVSNHQE